MIEETEELTGLFTSRGWHTLPLNEALVNMRFAGVYVSSYAAIGLLLLPNSRDVITGWADFQEAMLQIRKEQLVGTEKDLYLLLVVPSVEQEDAAELQTILDDTYVCRKILLEKRDRTLIETFADSPFRELTDELTTIATTSPPFLEELRSHVLPIPLLQDLATRSPRFVLSRALAGKYKTNGGKQ